MAGKFTWPLIVLPGLPDQQKVNQKKVFAEDALLNLVSGGCSQSNKQGREFFKEELWIGKEENILDNNE
jgi:hypothetical protein